MEIQLLLLEDHSDDATLIERALRRGGFRVTLTHANGRATFLDAIASGSFDVVVADYSLPDITGLQALAIVRERLAPGTPFVLISGAAGERLAVDAVKAGANDYILKDKLEQLAPAVALALKDAELERERKRAEDEIRRQRDELRSAHAIARLANWEWDVARDEMRWSDEMTGVMQVEPAEQPRTRAEFVALLPRAEQPRFDQVLSACEPFTFEHDLVRGDTTLRIIERARVEADSSGAPLRICGTAQDVTAQRRLEQQLARAERAQSLGRLAAAVAHEFNNVLMGVQPFCELADRHAEQPAKVHNAMQMIQQSVVRGRRIAQEILRYTAPSAPVRQPLRVADLFARLDPELRRRASLELDVPYALHVDADGAQIAQVLTNVIANARDAVEAAHGIGGGTIRIAAELVRGGSDAAPAAAAGNDFVHLTIADDGRGMSPEILNRAFEPLFTTKKPTGTGLGLAIVQQIVTAHGGHVHAESAPGRGTTVHLFLPAAVQPELAAEPAADLEWRPGRILLVEDEESIATGLQLLLIADGIDVHVARCGSEVEAAIAAISPDAIILDVGLPDIEGTEVFSRLRHRWPLLPVVFSTGHGEAASLEQYLSQPHVAHLLKPYDVDALYVQLGRAAR
ncbi:MAG TPA: response regulator [Thermoanaerobaculia bacterium]|jgi:signal transduction histidine kinase